MFTISVWFGAVISAVQGCSDSHSDCPLWAAQGQCLDKADQCQFSCWQCDQGKWHELPGNGMGCVDAEGSSEYAVQFSYGIDSGLCKNVCEKVDDCVAISAVDYGCALYTTTKCQSYCDNDQWQYDNTKIWKAGKSSSKYDGHCYLKPSPYMIVWSEAGWVDIGSSPGEQTMAFTYGVTRSHTVSKTVTWASKVTSNIGASGLNIFGVGMTGSLSKEMSKTISVTDTETMEESSYKYYSTTVKPGIVWQWQYKIYDEFGTTVVGSNHIQQTNTSDPPCCLPGYHVDIQQPRGACTTSEARICDDENMLPQFI